MGISKSYLLNSNHRVSGLGLTANGKRKIKSGKAYEALFPKPQNIDPFLTNNGTVYDTLEFCAAIIYKTLGDTKNISKLIKKSDLNSTLKACFDFFYTNYQYRIDLPGVEQLRRPARAYSDRAKGIDCDCFSISVSSILINLGIPHSLRMVKMYGRDYYQHIYVVVPKSPGVDMTKRTNYYVIDPVVDKYDLEAPGVTEIKDKQMTVQGMPIQYLNGVGSARLGEEFNGLGDNLDGADQHALHRDYCRRCKMNLINTRNHIARHPRQVAHIYNVQGLLGAYDQLIGAWDDENQRANVLERLSGIEESFLQPHLQGLGDVIHGTDDELFGLLNADLEGIAGLSGKKKQARKSATGSSTKKKKTGVFTKMKNGNKHAKGKGKGILKKIARGVFLKANPAIIPIRAGFLVAMKTNTLRIASRIYWALMPEAEALKAGVSRSFYQKALKGYAFIKKMFADRMAGSEDVLKKAIITGRAAKIAKKLASKGKLNGIDELMGVSGLGVVATATVAAAMTFLTAVAAFLTKVMGKQGNSEKEESETGGETDATVPDANSALTQTDTGPTVAYDNSEKLYNRYVNQSGGGSPAGSSDSGGDGKGAADDESDQGGKQKGITTKSEADEDSTQDTSKPTVQSSTGNNNQMQNTEDAEDDAAGQKESKGNGKGLAVAVVALAAIGTAVAVSRGKKKSEKSIPTNGLQGVAKKAIKKKIIKVTLK